MEHGAPSRRELLLAAAAVLASARARADAGGAVEAAVEAAESAVEFATNLATAVATATSDFVTNLAENIAAGAADYFGLSGSDDEPAGLLWTPIVHTRDTLPEGPLLVGALVVVSEVSVAEPKLSEGVYLLEQQQETVQLIPYGWDRPQPIPLPAVQPRTALDQRRRLHLAPLPGRGRYLAIHIGQRGERLQAGIGVLSFATDGAR